MCSIYMPNFKVLVITTPDYRDMNTKLNRFKYFFYLEINHL